MDENARKCMDLAVWAGAEIDPLLINMTEVQSSIHAVSRLQRDYSQNIL